MLIEEKMVSGKRGRWCFLASICFFLFTCGCAESFAPSRGLQKRMDISHLFESGTLLPDHTYYIDGSAIEPDAIIAISNSYQLHTNIWSQKDWTAENLKKAVFWMQTEAFGFCTVKGGVLIAPDGQQVGIWYSKRDRGIVRQPAAGIVEVFPFTHLPGSPCWKQALRDDV